MNIIDNLNEYVKQQTENGKIRIQLTISGRVYLAEKLLADKIITTPEEYFLVLNGELY